MAPYIAYGARPRGPISVIAAARALALIRGRDYVVAADVEALVRDAFRHRIVLSYQALAEEVTADMILDRLIGAVPVPRVAQDSLLARAEASERAVLVGGHSTPSARSIGGDPDDAFDARDEVPA